MQTPEHVLKIKDGLTFSEDNLAIPLTFSNAQDLFVPAVLLPFLPMALPLVPLPSVLTFSQPIFISETVATLQIEEQMVAVYLETCDETEERKHFVPPANSGPLKDLAPLPM